MRLRPNHQIYMPSRRLLAVATITEAEVVSRASRAGSADGHGMGDAEVVGGGAA
jgi:hypothetical protein